MKNEDKRLELYVNYLSKGEKNNKPKQQNTILKLYNTLILCVLEHYSVIGQATQIQVVGKKYLLYM